MSNETMNYTSLILQHKESIAELEKKITPYQERLEKMKRDNQSKIDARASLAKTISSKKTGKNTATVFGILLIVAGVIFYMALQNIMIAGVAAGVGVLLLIIAAVIAGGIKKCKEEYEQIRNELQDYDRDVARQSEKIDEITMEISTHQCAIEEIRLKEKYAEVDKWIESISVGYVGMYVTSEVLYAGNHEQPKPKKYTGSPLLKGTVGEVYINDMVYGTVYHNYDRDFELFEVDEQGTQRLECVVYYNVGGSPFTYQTQAKPVKFDRGSKFCWFHVQTCVLGSDQGTQVYGYMFDTFEEFLAATGITKDEIMKKFL